MRRLRKKFRGTPRRMAGAFSATAMERPSSLSTLGRYSLGGSSLEMVDAMNALKDTVLDFNRALHAYHMAKAGLRYAMGQTLSMEILGRAKHPHQADRQ